MTTGTGSRPTVAKIAKVAPTDLGTLVVCRMRNCRIIGAELQDGILNLDGFDIYPTVRPDPAEASEPLQSADRVYAPVDHGPGAGAMEEAGPEHSGLTQEVELDPVTIRACLAALPEPAEFWGGALREVAAEFRNRLEALLPKPDRAKEMQRAFEQHCAETGCQFSMIEGWRWAIAKGLLR